MYFPNGTLLYSIEAADNTRRFYHFDEMGNTTFLTDDRGGVPDSYAITPYCEIDDHLGSTDNPFTWQGQYGVIHEGQGLYNVRARHYDASASRFLSPDPFASSDPLEVEPYAYASGNPLLFIDPLGTRSGPAAPYDNALQLLNSIRAGQLDGSDPNSYVVRFIVFVNQDPGITWTQIESKMYPPVKPAPKPAPKLVPGTKPLVANDIKLDSGYLNKSTGSCTQTNTCGAGAAGQATQIPPPRGMSAQPDLHKDALGHLVITENGKDYPVAFDSHGNVISHDGGSVISHDGGSVISHDGGSLIAAAGSYVSIDGVAYLITQDGSGLISAALEAQSHPSTQPGAEAT